ncbi:hypothetical protein A6X21_00020 [Planctopirus hydrillae]|uniref:Uncharacterized protein n=1 Tax=Planctopirus hydrillae TaxID=1841610 RepID=A0A1C3EAP6_9PLAN|nr:hypothetical protein A6X21_00020 [Planctopirus hydrillae]
MNQKHGIHRFWTEPIEVNCKAGNTTLRLYRETENRVTVAAEVVFWDAVGQYYLETLNGDLPLEIIEELIIEAKNVITHK